MSRKKGSKKSRILEDPIGIFYMVIIPTMLLILLYLLYPMVTQNNSNDNNPSITYNDTETNSEIIEKKVLCELFVTTSCPACPGAEDTLKEIYQKRKDMVFVTLIADVNEDASNLAGGYGVRGVPTAIFDGGYKTEIGTKSKEIYIEDIDSCKSRVSIKVDIKIIYKNGNVNVRVSNPSGHNIEGKIRIYVYEITSRYKNIYGDPIPNGVLDVITKDDVSIGANKIVNVTESIDHTIVSQGNTGVAAAFFDTKTGYVLNSEIIEV